MDYGTDLSSMRNFLQYLWLAIVLLSYRVKRGTTSKYTYYARDIGHRDDHRIPLLEGVQYRDRSSCFRIVACPQEVSRRIRISLERVKLHFPIVGRGLLLSRAPIM